MPFLPPPSTEAVAALVAELRAQLGMVLFGVDVIINIDTHTLTVIDINIFPGAAAALTHILYVQYTHRHSSNTSLSLCLSLSGYEGVPQFFSSLLSHIESVLDKQTSVGPQATGPPESAQAASGGPSATTTGL